MNQVLNILSDLRVLAAIAVVVLILLIWMVITRVRTKSYQKDLKGYQDRYDELKNFPLQFKMNKANTIGRIDEETTRKVKEAQEVFDKYEENVAAAAEHLSDADDAISVGKLKKADGLLDQLDEELTAAKTGATTLNDMLDLILAKETTQRQLVTSYKNRFRALKSEAQEHSAELSYCWQYLEEKISSTEQMFSTFEEWMFSSDFEKANQELVNIKNSLDEIQTNVEQMPSLLTDARGVIPNMAENLHKDYARERNRGVYLKHIEIENNLSTLTVALKDDLKNLKSGHVDGVRAHLDDYKQRIQQLDDAVNKEGKAFDELNTLAQDTETQFAQVEKTFQYVTDHYDHTNVRFGLEGMDHDLVKRKEEFQRLQAERPRIMESVKNHMIPSTTVLVALKELNDGIHEISDSLGKMRTKIEAASGDEERARKQLVKLQIIMNQIQVKIRKYKLPNISRQYDSDMKKAESYIEHLKQMMAQVPLNIQTVNSALQEALDFIYKLYNDVNNVVGTVVMVENTIVFGNRYRSTYADIDSELTRAELAFRNGEYTQALTMAIATIEKIHPGNYEHMIKENAKGA